MWDRIVYNSTNDKGVKTKAYLFPAPNVDVINLPNSNRFGQKVADLADPLGIERYTGGLIGQGPAKPKLKVDSEKCQHTIFLFNDGSAKKILSAYGELLVKIFPPEDLAHSEFKATAVGHVHRPLDDESKTKYPHHVRDYWEGYNPEITRPSKFVHFVLAGQEKAIADNLTHYAVEKIAEGFLKSTKMWKSNKNISLSQRQHRNVLNLLSGTEYCKQREVYEEFVFRFAVKNETLTKEIWETDCREKVKEIAGAIAGGTLLNQDLEAFLAWPTESDEIGFLSPNLRRCNVYSYPENEPKVHIQVGSIHSVKGQTHTATLVLETFWYKSHLETLLPWLSGAKLDCREEPNQQEKSRLKLHYVAMTRPTHLLCLAMKQSSVSGEYREKLEKRGWDFVEVN